MHKAISTKVQGKTSFETKLNNFNQTFWFSTFYVVFGFLTHKKEKIDPKKKKNEWKYAKTNKQISTHTIDNQNNQTKSQSIGSIDAWTCCNAYA